MEEHISHTLSTDSLFLEATTSVLDQRKDTLYELSSYSQSNGLRILLSPNPGLSTHEGASSGLIDRNKRDLQEKELVEKKKKEDLFLVELAQRSDMDKLYGGEEEEHEGEEHVGEEGEQVSEEEHQASEEEHQVSEEEQQRTVEQEEANIVKVESLLFEEDPFLHIPDTNLRSKRLSLEEWVRRTPSIMRGEASNGPWLTENERVHYSARCYSISTTRVVLGRLIVSNKAVYFDPDPTNTHNLYLLEEEEEIEGEDRSKSYLRKKVPLGAINRLLLRRYRMVDGGMEMFLNTDGDASMLFSFTSISSKLSHTQVRDKVIQEVFKVVSRGVKQNSQTHPSRVGWLVNKAAKQWHNGSMSNLDYLLELNSLSGRSFHDLTQYPVVPWVFNTYSQYSSEAELFQHQDIYRDLSLPMGALNQARLEEFLHRYHAFDDPFVPKFHYGSHYSTMVGCVLYYLVRLEPFLSLHIDMQDHHLDVPDRLFQSVQATWDMCTTHLSEVKELTPEFYTLADFLVNTNQVDLGTDQSGQPVQDVVLPPWAQHSSDKFISVMRRGLESRHVSEHLHEWIDLVFGFKQKGKPAIRAHNVFYYLSYPGVVDLDKIQEPAMRNATLLQVAHFGQCPNQVFKKAHPVRSTVFRPLVTPFQPTKSFMCGVFGGETLMKVCVSHRRVIGVAESGRLHVVHWGLKEDKLCMEVDQEQALHLHRVYLESGTSLIAWTPPLLVSAGPVGFLQLSFVDLNSGLISSNATLKCGRESVLCVGVDQGVMVSGSVHGNVLLWVLYDLHHGNPFVRPKVGVEPRRMFLGHASAVQAVCVRRSLGVVISCSIDKVLVHSLVDGCMLACLSYTATWVDIVGVWVVMACANGELLLVTFTGRVVSCIFYIFILLVFSNQT